MNADQLKKMAEGMPDSDPAKAQMLALAAGLEQGELRRDRGRQDLNRRLFDATNAIRERLDVDEVNLANFVHEVVGAIREIAKRADNILYPLTPEFFGLLGGHFLLLSENCREDIQASEKGGAK